MAPSAAPPTSIGKAHGWLLSPYVPRMNSSSSFQVLFNITRDYYSTSANWFLPGTIFPSYSQQIRPVLIRQFRSLVTASVLSLSNGIFVGCGKFSLTKWRYMPRTAYYVLRTPKENPQKDLDCFVLLRAGLTLD